MIVLNVGAWISKDAGKTFSQISNNHGDNHELWWNPTNSDNWIQADDGGAEITYDGGKTFTEEDYPTCQFYHVALDNDFLMASMVRSRIIHLLRLKAKLIISASMKVTGILWQAVKQVILFLTRLTLTSLMAGNTMDN